MRKRQNKRTHTQSTLKNCVYRKYSCVCVCVFYTFFRVFSSLGFFDCAFYTSKTRLQFWSNCISSSPTYARWPERAYVVWVWNVACFVFFFSILCVITLIRCSRADYLRIVSTTSKVRVFNLFGCIFLVLTINGILVVEKKNRENILIIYESKIRSIQNCLIMVCIAKMIQFAMQCFNISSDNML